MNMYTTNLADNRSLASIYNATDGAVMSAVAEMLRDGKILDYMTKSLNIQLRRRTMGM